MITKQLTKSRKKIATPDSKIGNIGYQSTEFYHKASVGDTEINLSSLVMPDEVTGFNNPTSAVLVAAKLKWNRANFCLNSFRGKWVDRIDYEVVTSNVIKLKQPAQEGEIFHGVIQNIVRNQVNNPDLQSIVAVGTLAAGETEFNVGKEFRVNANPLYQIGELQVYRGNQLSLMLRNVGNAEADVLADGNYQEVNSGGGYGSVIKFNDAGVLGGELVVVLSTGRLLERPSNSLMQEIETLAGVMDNVIPYVEELMDFPAGTLKGAPSNADLKSFGDKVLANAARISALENEVIVSASAWVGPSNFVANLTTPINFSQIEYDSHNAITPSATAWRFTCPADKDGVYSLTFYMHQPSAVTHYINVFKNGVIYKTMAYFPNTLGAGSASMDLKLVAGDYISLIPSATATFSGQANTPSGLSNNANTHIGIKRIGK